MSQIKKFQYKEEQFSLIKDYAFGENWPVVYILKNNKEAYVGETVSLYHRSKQHYHKDERRDLDSLYVITDDDFNKSVVLDVESFLIQYMSADGLFKLQNGNKGLSNHNYYQRETYKSKFDDIWRALQKEGIVKNELNKIKNTDLFKYSPYKSLTEDQLENAEFIFNLLRTEQEGFSCIISGKPGTGKTILAVYLVKRIIELKKELKEFENIENIGLVVPMTSLRKTIKKVFRNIKGLSSNMVIGPSDVVKDKYDLLIIDESHRLKRRKNITNYSVFDKINKLLGLGKETGTELDWILRSSKYQIFFYDKNQSIKPTDVASDFFEKLKSFQRELKSQLRVMGGEEYVNFIDNVFSENKKIILNKFENYEFKMFDSIKDMVNEIKTKDQEVGLSRIVAGYAWPWVSKQDPTKFDIEIEGLKMRWNSVNNDWVNSKNAINEVGCIHTVQGYDLNYTGVIIGKELSYDFNENKFIIKKENYFDRNGRVGTSDENLKEYILNIYKTLFTRGINGTYFYVVDENLKRYFKSFL